MKIAIILCMCIAYVMAHTDSEGKAKENFKALTEICFNFKTCKQLTVDKKYFILGLMIDRSEV